MIIKLGVIALLAAHILAGVARWPQHALSAAVMLAHNTVTIAELHSDYQAAPAQWKTVNVVIVPGHEPDYGGAQFGTLYERDLVVELSQDLQTFLQAKSNYRVFVTRTTQAWNPTLADYFAADWNAIAAWEQASAEQMSYLVSIGSTTEPIAPIDHLSVPADVALRLYGITKWANENGTDIEIHVHLNDDPDHAALVAGKYTGFAIYVPAGQYYNSTTTQAVANAVYRRLAAYNPVSDLPGESGGIIDDPELIAVGANNTADAASMLIEYSYVYEPQFADPSVRSMALKDLAYQTYLGLEDFFNQSDQSASNSLSSLYGTSVLPYVWKHSLAVGPTASPDIYALQTALIYDGDYPPAGKSMNACPRTGIFGVCTRLSVKAFQQKHGIGGGDGSVGPQTLAALNTLFAGR